MSFNHLNYLCEWLCVIIVCNYEKKMLFFFGIKMVIYLTHSMYDLMKMVELPMKLVWIGLYILKHVQNFIWKVDIDCWFLMATIAII